MVDILVNANSALVTAGGTTAPAAGTVEDWTVTTAADFPVVPPMQFRVIDKADLGKTSGYEIIIVTASLNGTGVAWSVTRGAEDTAPYAHAPNWTAVPAETAASLSGNFPIGNPADITTATETPDPLSGQDSATWVQFPTDTPNENATVLAWGQIRDAFPRVVIDTTGSIVFGDGTYDPTVDGTGGLSNNGGIPFLIGGNSNIGLNVDGAGAIRFTGQGVGANGGDVTLFFNTGDPNASVTATAAGDLCFDSSTPAVWMATSAGTGWVNISIPGGADLTVNSGPVTSGLVALQIPKQPLVPASGIIQPLPPLIGRTFPGTSILYPLEGASTGVICSGPDGNLWITDQNGNLIQVTVDGAVTPFALGVAPYAICVGADGNLYVAEGELQGSSNPVYQVSTDGTLLNTFTFEPAGPVQFICAGPDGNIWLSTLADSNIWKMTPDGVFTAVPLPSPGLGGSGICAGPDGRIWIVDGINGALFAITTDGVVSEPFALEGSSPNAICAGQDGNLWVTDGNGAVWRVTPDGDAGSPITLDGSSPVGIAAGAGGDIWAADSNGALWKVTMLGVPTPFSLDATPLWICSGPDGALWMNDPANAIVMPFTVQMGGLNLTTGPFSVPLPTSDPETTDQLWNSAGTVRVSGAGPAPSGGGLAFYGTGQDGPAVVPATSRTVTDAVLTPGSATLTSDTADFTDDDLNTFLSDDPNVLAFGLGAINPGTRILAVISATEVTMTEAANASADSAADDYVAIGYNVVQGGLAYTDVTIEEGATFVLQPGKTAGALDGPILFGTGTFTIDGALDLSGGDADGIESGTNPLGPANDGAAGTTGAGTVGGADVDYPYAPGTGGAGGSGSTASPNDTPGGPTLIFPKWSVSLANDPMVIRSGSNQYANGLFSGPWPGCPGSSGGGDGVNSSGGGGGAGLGALIAFPHIVHGPENNYILTGGNGGTPVDTVATLGADSPVTLPLTIDTGTNDEFVYTPAATGIPEIFTMAPVTLATLADALTAMGAAVGSSAEAFSTLVTPSDGGDGFIELTTVATGSAQNGSTISFGANDVAADLGFTGNPDTFSNALDAGNCGGGGGGAAGWWMTISQDLTGDANITGSGGVGGTGSGTGTDGGNGSDGFVIHVIN